MPTDSIGLILLFSLMIGLFIVMAHLDIYFSKRRNHLANARYQAEMHAVGRIYITRLK